VRVSRSSPQGLLRTIYGDVTDQIVDGGYFENDGLATISDVAHALRAGFDLDPVVIRIGNEPSKPEDAAANKTRPPAPATAAVLLLNYPSPAPPRKSTFGCLCVALLSAIRCTFNSGFCNWQRGALCSWRVRGCQRQFPARRSQLAGAC
jgi:hypothetical protein